MPFFLNQGDFRRISCNQESCRTLGAIVGSTDAAAVFAVFGSKNIKEKLSSTIEAESGTNDPMAVFLTVTIISIIEMPGDNNVFLLFLSFFWQMGVGLLAGIIIRRSPRPSSPQC